VNKVVASLQEAVADISDGAVIFVGGFGGSGNPFNLIDALVQRGLRNLTIVGNDSSHWLPFVEKGQAKKIISGFTNHPLRSEITKIVDGLVRVGKLEAETVPHGTLEERMRAAGMGIAGFYTPTGVGTVVEQGKEKRVFDGREYILELALKGDFALIKGYKADRYGNIICRFGAGNRNIVMATAARVTIAEVEEVVDVGQLDPERVDIPGIFVHMVVKAPKKAVWLIRGEM